VIEIIGLLVWHEYYVKLHVQHVVPVSGIRVSSRSAGQALKNKFNGQNFSVHGRRWGTQYEAIAFNPDAANLVGASRPSRKMRAAYFQRYCDFASENFHE
jgi:hypothetical protein